MEIDKLLQEAEKKVSKVRQVKEGYTFTVWSSSTRAPKMQKPVATQTLADNQRDSKVAELVLSRLNYHITPELSTRLLNMKGASASERVHKLINP